MHYLVTGGAGFIGSNIVAELVRRGQSVRVLDDFSSGRPENIVDIKDKIEVVRGDIRDREAVRNCVKDVDYVIHQAAIPSVEVSVRRPVESSEVNINGTIHLLEESKRAGVKRFVFASSAAVYGDLPDLPKSEDSRKKTLSPYAAAKLVGEYYCKMYYELYGLQTVCLRYFNVFGPNQDPASEYAAVIPKFIQALLSDSTPKIFGDGLQSRDFIYISDVVSANLKAIEARDVAGESFNIAGGKQINLLDLLNSLKDILKKEVKPVFEDEKPGDIRHSVADVSKAREHLGHKADVGLSEGLSLTVDYFRNTIAEQVKS